MPTEELLRRARRGDEAAVGQLLEKHRSYLRFLSDRYLAQGLKARVDASDIVQQTCLTIHKKIEHLDIDEPQAFLAWLRQAHLQIVKNVLREHIGTAKRSLTREETAAATMIFEDRCPAETPSQRLMDRETAVELTAALEQLSEPQREAIRLRFLEGLRLKEVAQRMQRSEPTVVGLIHRGLIRLKTLLPAETGDNLSS